MTFDKYYVFYNYQCSLILYQILYNYIIGPSGFIVYMGLILPTLRITGGLQHQVALFLIVYIYKTKSNGNQKAECSKIDNKIPVQPTQYTGLYELYETGSQIRCGDMLSLSVFSVVLFRFSPFRFMDTPADLHMLYHEVFTSVTTFCVYKFMPKHLCNQSIFRLINEAYCEDFDVGNGHHCILGWPSSNFNDSSQSYLVGRYS